MRITSLVGLSLWLLHGACAQEATLQLLDSTKYPTARCLDGSPGGFYIQKSLNVPDSKKWTINLEGGGECVTSRRCIPQANSTLGSSKNWGKTTQTGFYGNPNKDQNPDLWGWNHVKVAYCTQDLWTGQVTEATNGTYGLYFAGHIVFDAVLKTLESDFGLADAENIVLSGDSAGGIGVWPNLDWLAGMYPSTHVVGAPVAGFYFYADPYTGPGHTSSELADFREPAWPQHYALWNSFVDADCLREQAASPWACILANNTKSYVKTRAFITEAQTDKVVLLDHDWLPSNLQPQSDVKPYMEEWRNNMTAATAPRLASGDGFFNPACFVHTGFSPEKPLIGGLNFLQVFGNWYFNRSGPKQAADTCGIMCNPTCP